MRHTFNLSALYNVRRATGALQRAGGCSAASSTRAAACRSRADHAPRHRLRGRGGQRVQQPGGRTARRSSTRPAAAARATCGGRTWSPASTRIIKDGGLLFLNPAAFATPQPGTFGNLERNSIHGRASGRSTWSSRSGSRWRQRTERSSSGSRVFNLFNTTTSPTRSARCPTRCRTTALDRGEPVQPEQPFTSAAAGTFGTTDEHRWPHGGPGHEPPGAVRVPTELLIAPRRSLQEGSSDNRAPHFSGREAGSCRRGPVLG